MTAKSPILITGAAGLLGHALCQTVSRQGAMIGIYHERRPVYLSGEWLQMDLTDTKALRQCIQNARPGGVIHAAAVAQTSQCQGQDSATEVSEVLNVSVPARLADICADLGIPLVFTSTDLVFDGHRPPYSEDSPPSPVNVYGKQKARAEEQVLARWPQALVCRMPLMMGAAPNAGNNFTVQMLAAIAANRPVGLYHDEFRTPVDIWSAAQGIVQFLGRQCGVLHLGGRTRVSRLDMGLAAAQCMGVNPTMIQSVSAASQPGADQRAPDCSLDSRRAFDLGYAPADFKQGMQRTIDQWRQLTPMLHKKDGNKNNNNDHS